MAKWSAIVLIMMVVIAVVLTLGEARSAEVTRILVGFPPGQATDLVARLLADRLTPLLGETVIVENRPGQGGSIALASLSQSPADGRTMVLAPLASLVVNPHMYKTVGYDTFKDLAPVAQVADLPDDGDRSDERFPLSRIELGERPD